MKATKILAVMSAAALAATMLSNLTVSADEVQEPSAEAVEVMAEETSSATVHTLDEGNEVSNKIVVEIPDDDEDDSSEDDSSVPEDSSSEDDSSSEEDSSSEDDNSSSEDSSSEEDNSSVPGDSSESEPGTPTTTETPEPEVPVEEPETPPTTTTTTTTTSTPEEEPETPEEQPSEPETPVEEPGVPETPSVPSTPEEEPEEPEHDPDFPETGVGDVSGNVYLVALIALLGTSLAVALIGDKRYVAEAEATDDDTADAAEETAHQGSQKDFFFCSPIGRTEGNEKTSIDMESKFEEAEESFFKRFARHCRWRE